MHDQGDRNAIFSQFCLLLSTKYKSWFQTHETTTTTAHNSKYRYDDDHTMMTIFFCNRWARAVFSTTSKSATRDWQISVEMNASMFYQTVLELICWCFFRWSADATTTLLRYIGYGSVCVKGVCVCLSVCCTYEHTVWVWFVVGLLLGLCMRVLTTAAKRGFAEQI